MSRISLEPFNKKIIDELMKSIGPQGIVDFVDRQREDQSAFKEAKKVRLPANIAMRDVLPMYPINIVKSIALEWELDPNKRKDSIIKDIVGAMADIIPDVIDGASDGELEAIKYIVEHDNLKIKDARRLLNDSIIEPEFMDPDSQHMFDSFMEVYTRLGILIIGVRKVSGRDREIVTMASDVRRIVAKHTGQNIAFEQKAVPDSKTGHPQVAAGGRKQIRWPAEREQKPKGAIVGMQLDAPLPHNTSTNIFNRGKIEVRPGDIFDDPFDAMTAYVMVKYRNEFEVERKGCPYYIKNLDDDVLVFKQHMTWFLAEWINPATGTTIVEEFVKETVMDKEAADTILSLTELFFDRFEVREHRGNDIIAYGTGTRKTYRIATSSGSSMYPIGSRFEGRIHPYEGKYKMCGIISRHADTT